MSSFPSISLPVCLNYPLHSELSRHFKPKIPPRLLLSSKGENRRLHEAQLLTYLKLGKKPLGLLINFNVPMLRQGVKRVACGDLFQEETGGHSFAFRMVSYLCASVPLWFK